MRMQGAKRLGAVLCSVLLVLSAFLVSVPRKAQAEGYTYTVRIFGGNEGLVNGESMYVLPQQFTYGEECKLDTSWVTHLDGTPFSTDDGSQYYVKGFRISGQDNRDAESRSVLNNMVFDVTEDMDLIVAYGAKGDMVSYTVHFVEYGSGDPVEAEIAEGETADHVTFQGKKGDKVVVPYEYVPGYRPRYRNITGTLGDEGENEWNLEYIRLESGETAEPGETGVENPEGTTTTTTATPTTPTTTTTTTTTGTTTTVATPATPTTTTTTTTATGGGDNENETTVDDEGAEGGDENADQNADQNADDNAEGNADDNAPAGGEDLTPTEPPATEDILDVDNPLASPTGMDESDATNDDKPATSNTQVNEPGGLQISLPLILGALGVLLAIALLAYYLIRRKNDDEDNLDDYV